eukprot:g13134.t2
MLEGAIPTASGTLRSLKFLRLSRNSLSGFHGFNGLALCRNHPKELVSLQKLEILRLSNNELTGSISKELGALSKLERLWLRNKQLTGQIPKELGSLRTLMITGAGQEEPWAISLVEFLELLTELQFYAAETRTNMVTGSSVKGMKMETELLSSASGEEDNEEES